MSAEEFVGKVFHPSEDRCHNLTAVILRFVSPYKPLRLLDIGCGTGRQIFELAAKLPLAAFDGVDISEENILAAQSELRYSSYEDRVSFHCAEYMNFSCDPYDVIISDSVFHLIEARTDTLFTKISNDLNYDGLLIFSIPHDCWFNHLLWMLRRILRSIRCSLSDFIILSVAKIIHHKTMDVNMLKQRLHYMYILPARVYSKELRSLLTDSIGMQYITEMQYHHSSFGQSKHKLIIMKQIKHNWQK
ncbi:MAG: class I SAM-dependent methyltransferase [Syntrophobacteraceae bacterium]|jgi:trans-aconitate methyltransferase